MSTNMKYSFSKYTVEVILNTDCFAKSHSEEATAMRQYDRVSAIDDVMVRLWHGGKVLRSTAWVEA